MPLEPTIDPADPEPTEGSPAEATEHNVADHHVPVGADYVSDRQFAELPISPEVLKGVADLGYVTATPVQAAAIEPMLAGKDMLVRAKTGTGKTAAFCVPVVERIEAGNRRTQAIVLAPTRELAQQIGEEAAAIAKYRDCNVAVLVGGLAMGPQEQALERGAEIVVGTPGRILDHLRRKNLSLADCRMAVLDEADEMLSMGFYEDVTSILDATSKDRQVALFSATISDETKRLADTYLREPENLRLSTDADNVESIEHILYETTPDLHKVRALLYLLDVEDPTSAIIFCNTREDTATVASFLDRQGLDVQLLSGELSQARRSQVMKKVKAGEVRFLVSTDVAARGIDISDLSHVINYSLPQDPSVYLHRTGRTGRIGKKGTAISLVGGPDLSTKKILEHRHGIRFDARQLPDATAAVGFRVERQARQIKDAMGSLVFESYLPTIAALRGRPDGDMLLAAALRAFFQWDRQRRAAMSDVDSIGELIQQRNEKLDRKARARSERAERERGDRGGRGRDRDRGDRDRGERKGRDRDKDRDRDRKQSTPISSSGRPAADEDLDALLLTNEVSAAPVAEDAGPKVPVEAADAEGDGDRKKKRRRRRKKKGAEGAPGAGGDDADDADGDVGGSEPIDELDALLTTD